VIVLDASAALAILLEEPDAELLEGKLAQASNILMSPVNLWEVLVRARAFDGEDGERGAETFLTGLDVNVVPIDIEIARTASTAFARFGKRTPAGLNMGDCFAYALAKARDAPLLFKGGDFARTDVRVA